jgi:hypothetical protein
VATLLLIGAPAVAQRADRPDVKVGDRWTFAVHYTVPTATPSRVWLITSVTADGIEGQENGEALKLSKRPVSTVFRREGDDAIVVPTS